MGVGEGKVVVSLGIEAVIVAVGVTAATIVAVGITVETEEVILGEGVGVIFTLKAVGDGDGNCKLRGMF